MIIIAIDPGLSGAGAILDTDGVSLKCSICRCSAMASNAASTPPILPT
jgi:hypothetical protein